MSAEDAAALQAMARAVASGETGVPEASRQLAKAVENGGEDWRYALRYARDQAIYAAANGVVAKPQGNNKEPIGTHDKPPSGSVPTDKTPWSGDHGTIKGDQRAGETDRTHIAPNRDAWTLEADGSWSNEGPANHYTSSGNAAGQTGSDRNGKIDERTGKVRCRLLLRFKCENKAPSSQSRLPNDRTWCSPAPAVDG